MLGKYSITQKELQNHLGLGSPTTIQNKLNGTSRFTVDELEKMANLFNVELDYFFVRDVSKTETTNQ